MIVFGGRPGTGKTTLAMQVTRALSATYLRIDVIETALSDASSEQVYSVAVAVATSNLAIGKSVVVDGLNAVEASRSAWRGVTAERGCHLVEIELTCSDASEHQRRVEARVADIAGHSVPNWSAVKAIAFEPMTGQVLAVDTAAIGPYAAVENIDDYVMTIAGGRR